MLLILLSWIYIFITTLNFGILFKNLFRIQNCHVVIHHILGLFFYTIITSIAAFFIRINIEFYLVILFLNSVIYFTNKNAFKRQISAFFNSIRALKPLLKTLFIIIFLITLAQSATKPYILDNESYYIQTIKWINEFGYVKGLANLHMFFAQNSAWHTLQAGFNFSFITDFLNDLNGFLFVLISLLVIEKLQNYKSETDLQGLCLGLILLFAPFFMQFINAPSPDLLIFLLTPYVFYMFITQFDKIDTDSFKVFLSLIAFLCFVKVTIAITSVLVLILFIKNFQSLKHNIVDYVLLGSVVLVIFITKNVIISGYALFPIEVVDLFNFDWKQPKVLMSLSTYGTSVAAYSDPDVSLFLNSVRRFLFWLNTPKLHGVFNKTYILLLLIYPWFIYKLKTRGALLTIYIVALLQFVILWNSSPQYRFFFVFIIFLSIQILVSLFKNKKILIYFVLAGIFLSAVPLFIEVNLKAFTNNSLALKLTGFNLKNMLIPEKNSKNNTEYSKENIDGFEFYSPINNTFFWGTGNGNLPCVNKNQINYIRKSYNYTPQLRTNMLKDGFKSLKVED